MTFPSVRRRSHAAIALSAFALASLGFLGRLHGRQAPAVDAKAIDAIFSRLMPGVFAPAQPGTPNPTAPPRPTPSAAQLAAYAGTYVSDEAETTLVAEVADGTLVLKRRPATVIRLTPAAGQDTFTGSIGTITFRRDATGRVVALSVKQDRVWDLRFDRR
jgi:Domain of unknown function (DUF3471)